MSRILCVLASVPTSPGLTRGKRSVREFYSTFAFLIFVAIGFVATGFIALGSSLESPLLRDALIKEMMLDQVCLVKGCHVLPDEVAAQCLALAERWKGCEWSTKHGSSELNLQGMSASQAELMARATAGPESKEWRSAAKWLRQLELDIATIAEEIRRAAFSIELGEYQRALTHVELACSIEGKYRSPVICQSLRDWLWEASNSPVPNRPIRDIGAPADVTTKPADTIAVN